MTADPPVLARFDGKLKPYPHNEHTLRGRAPDPVAYLQAKEQRARERQVAYETLRLLHERVAECYRKEGVNSFEYCHELAHRFHDLANKKDLGQLQPEWSDPDFKNP